MHVSRAELQRDRGVRHKQFTQLEVVAIVEFMYTLYSLTFQVRVNAGDSGLFCIRVSSL